MNYPEFSFGSHCYKFGENANTANHLLHNCLQLFPSNNPKLNKLYINLFEKMFQLYFRRIFCLVLCLPHRGCRRSLARSNSCSRSSAVVEHARLANGNCWSWALPKSHWIVKELRKREKIWMHNCVDRWCHRDRTTDQKNPLCASEWAYHYIHSLSFSFGIRLPNEWFDRSAEDFNRVKSTHRPNSFSLSLSVSHSHSLGQCVIKTTKIW